MGVDTGGSSMDKNGNGKWTAKMVAAQMEEAVRTLRLLRISGLKPRGYVSSWPDVVIDLADASGQDEVKLRLDPPTPEAITRMDEALQWLCQLEPDQARLVWMHAEGVPRKTICAKVGMSRMTAWRVWMASLMTIASTINVSRRAMQSDKNKDELFHREYHRTGNASAAYRMVFPCEGLSNDIIHDRSRRLVKKHQTGSKAPTKTVSTGETGAR